MAGINKISMRFQTPSDAEGNRKDIHPITTSDEVIMFPESNNPKRLTDVFGDVTTAVETIETSIENINTTIDNVNTTINETSGIIVSEEKPNKTCLWAKPLETLPAPETV